MRSKGQIEMLFFTKIWSNFGFMNILYHFMFLIMVPLMRFLNILNIHAMINPYSTMEAFWQFTVDRANGLLAIYHSRQYLKSLMVE